MKRKSYERYPGGQAGRHALLSLGILLLALPALGADYSTEMPERHRVLLEEHCQRCHNAEKSKGRFRVDDLPFSLADIETRIRLGKAGRAGDEPRLHLAREWQPDSPAPGSPVDSHA